MRTIVNAPRANTVSVRALTKFSKQPWYHNTHFLAGRKQAFQKAISLLQIKSKVVGDASLWYLGVLAYRFSHDRDKPIIKTERSIKVP